MAVYLSLLAGAGAQFFTDAGTPLTGGLLYTYAAGTTTPAATYTDSTGLTANTNPIVLNSAGRVAGEVWVTGGVSYKFVLKTATLTTIGTWDNVSASADTTALSAALAASGGSALIGFLQSGTGAVARTLQSKGRDIVSVKDFGAYGNGSNDDTAAIQAANDAVYAAGGGEVHFPAGTYRTTGQIDRSVGVSFIGAGRGSTKLDARHNGPIVRCFNTLLPAIQDDNYSVVSGLWFTTGGGFTPSYGLVYRCLGFTRVEDCRFDAAILNGIWCQFVLNSRFSNLNIESATGISLYSTGVADGCNLNIFDEVACANNATCALLIEAPGSYQNEFRTCSFFTAGTVSVDHIYSCKTRFVNCTWEANLTKPVKLRGGDGISFVDCSQIDPYTFIDSATFGARNVVFERFLLWNTNIVTPQLLSAEEITVRDSVYTLDEPVSVDEHEELHLTSQSHSTGRQFAHFPGYANFSATAAKTNVTPFGGVILAGAYNRVGSWDMSNAVQWSAAGTAGATDPFGGTSAYNINSITSQHTGFSLVTAATGRTFTFQVWAKFNGRVRLGIGTIGGGIKKFANFYSSNADWMLLSITYTSGVDADTSPFVQILTSQNTVMWRPCHYESLGPQPTIQPGRNLVGIATPMQTEDTRIVTYSNAAPVANTWAVGDTVRQSVPVVGQPKGWRCTVGGTPGTWVSEGNL